MPKPQPPALKVALVICAFDVSPDPCRHEPAATNVAVPAYGLSAFTTEVWCLSYSPEVLSSFEDPDSTSNGTLITFEEDDTMEQAIISGIAFNRDEAKISLMGVEDRPGIAYAILGPIAAANVDVDMIVQNIGASGHTDFSFTVNRGEYQKALDVLEHEKNIGFAAREIIGDNKICKVSLVGIGMRSHVGIAAKMFKSLAEEGINIQMISTSEIKTSVVIDEKYLELAVRVLHRAFELEQAPKVA